MNTKQIKELARMINSKQHKTPITLEQALAKIKPALKTQADLRLQKAIASHYPKTSIEYTLRAVASTDDPFMLNVEMTLLPLDKPNRNHQCVPASEANNILTTATHKPIRALFTGDMVYGHASTDNIGMITDVFRRDNIIYGNGLIWIDNNEDLAKYLKATAELYGSFEIYYERAEKKDNIEYLHGCIFAAHCVVSTPAYGTDTPIKVKS